MQVLYYASLISISILVALFIKYKLDKSGTSLNKPQLKALPAIVIFGWIIWTVIMLSGPFIQSGGEVVYAYQFIDGSAYLNIKLNKENC